MLLCFVFFFCFLFFCFFFSSRRRHTRYWRDWSSDVCSSDLEMTRTHMKAAAIIDSGSVEEWLELVALQWVDMFSEQDLFMMHAVEKENCITYHNPFPALYVLIYCYRIIYIHSRTACTFHLFWKWFNIKTEISTTIYRLII